MSGTSLVLITLAVSLLFLIVLVTVFRLAKRNGQQLKSVSWSPLHGFTITLYEGKEKRGST